MTSVGILGCRATTNHQRQQERSRHDKCTSNLWVLRVPPSPCVHLCLGPSAVSLSLSIVNRCTRQTPTRPPKHLCRPACLSPTNCLDDLECDHHEDCRRQDQDESSMDGKSQVFVDSCASTSPSLMTNSIQQAIWALSNVPCNDVGFVLRSGCRP